MAEARARTRLHLKTVIKSRINKAQNKANLRTAEQNPRTELKNRIITKKNVTTKQCRIINLTKIIKSVITELKAFIKISQQEIK